MNRIEKLINKKKFIPLNQFINIALYDKELGYYQNKKIFGRNGDFITSPHISSIFSEMISIWIVSYWLYIKKPKKINILELGPGNGLMIKQIINSIKKIKTYNGKFTVYLLEKSKKLIKIQKNNLKDFNNIIWVKNINKINQDPTIIVANEFFDAFPIKQFFKEKNSWYEQCVAFDNNDKKNITYYKNKINNSSLKKYSNFYNINKSKTLEYTINIETYINSISKIIKNNNGLFIGCYRSAHYNTNNKMLCLISYKDSYCYTNNDKYINNIHNIKKRQHIFNARTIDSLTSNLFIILFQKIH